MLQNWLLQPHCTNKRWHNTCNDHYLSISIKTNWKQSCITTHYPTSGRTRFRVLFGFGLFDLDNAFMNFSCQALITCEQLLMCASGSQLASDFLYPRQWMRYCTLFLRIRSSKMACGSYSSSGSPSSLAACSWNSGVSNCSAIKAAAMGKVGWFVVCARFKPAAETSSSDISIYGRRNVEI